MRYTRLFGKTKKDAPKDEVSLNAQLLIKAGFIHKEMAGVYTYLPLGLKTLNKIINIIRDEMNKIGAQEMLLTALQEKELWECTNRWDDEVVDVWFKTKLKNDTEVGLGFTHEEPLTRAAAKQIQSYKDLPFYAYQFQTKFRNETRSKSGVLRTREFIMKDLYSFSRTPEEHEEFYERAKQAYFNVFRRTGIGDVTYLTFASGGVFSKYSHEFQTLTQAGEDVIYVDKEKNIAINQEVLDDEVLNVLNLKRENLIEEKSIEVGNIFKLGTKFSEPLGLKYTTEKGTEETVFMGSYGIGPGRLLGTIVEVCSDDKGIVWPDEAAPYKAHLVGLNLEDTQVAAFAEEVYERLVNKGVEVLFDDRTDTSTGQKFADADLIGCPYRIVVSKRLEKKLEVKRRNKTESQTYDFEQLISLLT